MGPGYFTQAGIFLVGAIFGIVALLFMLRLMLQAVRANFYNPICQFLYSTTNPVLMPLRRALPAIGGVDTAALVVVLLLQAIKMALILLLAGRPPGLPALLLLALAETLSLVLWVWIIAIFVRVILSFLGPQNHNPVVPLLYQLTEPLMAPVRARLPDGGGLDLSPLVVLLVLFLARILVYQPIFDLGWRMA